MSAEDAKEEDTLIELGGIISDLKDLRERMYVERDFSDNLEPLLGDLTSLLRAQKMLEGSTILDKIAQEKKSEINQHTFEYLESLVRYLWEQVYFKSVFSDVELTQKQIEDKKRNLEESLEGIGYSELFPMLSSSRDLPDGLELSHYDEDKHQLIWTAVTPQDKEPVEFRLPISYISNPDEWETDLWEELEKRSKEKLTVPGLEHLASSNIRSTIKRVKEFERLAEKGIRRLEEQSRPLLGRFLNYATTLLETNIESNVSKSMTAVMVSATGVKNDTDVNAEHWTLQHIDQNKCLVWHYTPDNMSGRAEVCYLDEEYCDDPDTWEKNFTEGIAELIVRGA